MFGRDRGFLVVVGIWLALRFFVLFFFREVVVGGVIGFNVCVGIRGGFVR